MCCVRLDMDMGLKSLGNIWQSGRRRAARGYLLTPAVVLQLGHAPDELADGLVLGNEIKDLGGSPAKVQIPLPSLGFEAWTLDSISHQNNIIYVKTKFLRCGLCRGPCL